MKVHMNILLKAKRITIERAKPCMKAAMAGKEAGIDFNFDDSKVANSYKAHLLIQLSKPKFSQ